ncbi:protein ITPRID2 isoform X2 [Bombina bombina]|nr:protein ITPRID2 isoform X2 [Bombina bombina]
MLLKNGGSFEDDLSLGAEANHLHQSNLPIEPICNGMLAKDRRLQYHQKGRSMNSTGSAKSSATVSSVSELLDLYEEDPEEILYNLGFGRDEPDIASKIPSRFFNSSSFARGIDIKVFLSAQMQRLEVENPNYALTSRFRQIEVLTTVANAFSSLYSQVSGTPLQRIGSSASLSTNKEPDKPAPLNRTTSQTASRLMKTLSKLNLYGTQPTGEGAISSPGTDNQGLTPKSNEDDANKTEKLQKPFKKNSPPLATVKEEASNSLLNVDTHSPVISLQLHEKLVDELAEACSLKQEESLSSQNECNASSIIDLSPPKDIVSTDTESEINLEETSPHTSTPDKQLCTPLSNPSIKSLASFQTKDSSSFEMEEVQSTEEETLHIPSTCQSVLEKLSKDNLLRTASQHSDSSGFAEDPSSDCPLNSLQVHEPLQTMGSSADSCDSETTVTSVCDDLKTPLATDPPEPIDFEIDEFLTPIDLNESKVFFGTNQEISKENVISENQMGIYEDCKTQEELNSSAEINQDNSEEELQHQCTVESELETGSEYELVPYMTHHISESVDCFSDYDDGFHQLGKAETGSLERVNVALQRAQMKMISSETSGSKRGRSLVKSKDLLKRRHKLSDSGYPLRRTQSLPSEMLSPVRVVSKVNIVLSSGKATVCSPPTFSYKYSPEEQECMEPLDEEANTNYKSTLPISKKSEYKENYKTCPNRITDDTNPVGSQSSSMQTTSQRSHSSCSLHSLQSDWHERPLCEYARTWSTHSVPCFSGASCGALVSPYGCPLAQRLSCGSLNRSYSGYSLPAMSAPSTTEMQLRRVLHDIRNSLQNLSQHPLMRGSDGTTSGYNNQRPSVLPLYENTFQELQIMKRSLNLFRTQMMDLELNMLRQQTLVYQHLTDEERYEADQLQGLRNSVRMELQELELQLDERLMTLEEQLRNFHMSSPFHRSSNMVLETYIHLL